jgi:two-component system KDP operon response regulator KdpE
MKVLIVEDDQETVDIISLAFQIRWPEAKLVSTGLGEEAAELVEGQAPDVVILDLGLPDISGFEVLKQIRLFSNVPIIILTAREDEAYVVKGLEWGADEYVAKPFRQLELLARVKAVMRRKYPKQEERPIDIGALHLDPILRRIRNNGQEVALTRTECLIMQHLMQNAGRVVTHSSLAETIWEDDYPGAAHSLRVYIQRLREKLEKDPHNPELILTNVGVGYLLAKPS